MKIDDTYYLARGPNGKAYVRTKADRSAAYSVAAFLSADYIPASSKAALRTLLGSPAPGTSGQLTPEEARDILQICQVCIGVDFHALRVEHVECLAEQARARGYRKRKDAPGSTARMYHAYLQRVAQRA